MGTGLSQRAAFGLSPYRPSRRRLFALCGAAVVGAVAALPVSPARADDAPAAGPQVRREDFGKTPDGTAVDLYVLTSGAGVEARVITYGATLIALNAPDRAGKVENLTLCFDTAADYTRNSPLFGATVGRFANRISNAKFTLDGADYKVTANAGRHHIHGGNAEAFHRVLWKAEPVREAGAAAVRLTHVTKDGDAGYPGTVDVSVTFKLTRDNELFLDYTARTDKATPINLTNHAYWNLAGAGSGDVLGHVLTIHADQYLEADREKIPSGKILPVKGTPQDFNTPTAVGTRIAEVESKNYDHCYLLATKPGAPPALCARVTEPKSGRVMEVFTTQPAVQLYTAAGLSNRLKGGGKTYGPYHGLCLETEHYPDSPNRPEFPSCILRPGQDFHEVTIYKFSVEK